MIQSGVSLKQYNTFGIDVKAKYFASFDSVDSLGGLLEYSERPLINSSRKINTLTLGGGSNMLFTKDFDGLVLKNEIAGIEKIKEDDEHVFIKCGAGESWHGLVLYCIKNGWSGVENLSLIPGRVGASPMQNIGAYGVEIKDVFHQLEAYHIADKKLVSFDYDDCEFGYRESVFKKKFKNQFIITNVIFKLNKKPFFNISYGAIEQELEHMGIHELSIKAVSDAVINIRRGKLPDPAVIGNAGSFFKNPTVSAETYLRLRTDFPGIVGFPQSGETVKLAAGWLIEQCGWKGLRRGDAGCHTRQALVLVNYGTASGREVYDLSEDILQSVKSKFGVTLEREVNII